MQQQCVSDCTESHVMLTVVAGLMQVSDLRTDRLAAIVTHRRHERCLRELWS